MKLTVKLFSIFFITFFLVPGSFAIDGSKETFKVSESITKLRSLYFQQDWDGGVSEGQKLVPAFGESNELRAWFILNQALSDDRSEAIAAAETFTKDLPNDSWSWFALAGALAWNRERSADALGAAEKAFNQNPAHEDFIWLRAEVLRAQGKNDEALAFIEESLPKVKNQAELLVVKARILYAQSEGKPRNEVKAQTAFATFEAARSADASCVNAYYVPATLLFQDKKYEEAYPMLKRAVEIAPTTLKVHSLYWQATSGLSNLLPDKKKLEIEADMTRLLNARQPNAEILFAVRQQYSRLNVKDKRKEFEEKILKEFPGSKEAEYLMDVQIQDFYTNNARNLKDTAIKTQYRQMLTAFIKRPQHHNKLSLGNAYLSLFVNVKNDKSVTNEEIYSIVKGMAENTELNPEISFIQGPTILANRGFNLSEAEQFARKGPDAIKKFFEGRRRYYETEKDFNQAVNETIAASYDTIGWILFKAKRNNEAETELLRAYALDILNENNLYHLGQFYETVEKFDKAEEFYMKGSVAQSSDKNPNLEALKALYLKRKGSMAGYEAYEANLKEKEKNYRKTIILRERIAAPRAFIPFNLKSLSGKDISSETLTGKVMVINFWGVWCGWCTKEMADMQKLQEKYANDPDVLVLTINNDENLSTVQKWMKENKYNFSVLLENGYNKQADIRNYPTTWFIDKKGRIAYVKHSYTKELVDEFSWRIEDLKANNF